MSMRPKVWNLTSSIFGQNDGHHNFLRLGMAALQIDLEAEARLAELQIKKFLAPQTLFDDFVFFHSSIQLPT